MGFDERTCVVTGASRGIGAGIARELGEEGANVVVNYRSSVDAAEETADAVEAAGGDAIVVQADVTDTEAVERMHGRTREAFGDADVLVNNAGVNQDVRFAEMSREQWDQVIEVNLGGLFTATKEFFDDLQESEHGRLVNISSIVGKQGNFGQANYATAKSGVLGFTRTLALELAPHGSTANVVAPGFIRTDMLEGVPDRHLDTIREDIPLDRFGTVEDVACVVRFLASEDAGYVTGEVIDVNGGKDL